MLEADDGEPVDDPVVTRPFHLDQVNATLTRGQYTEDEDEDEDES